MSAVTAATGNHKLFGVVFLVLCSSPASGSPTAIFTKKFADYDQVTLQTSTIGLQLPARADVKIRGVLVGEVLDFDTDADGAELTLGLYPSQIDTIPANVTGSIVPKTLFGEKYVVAGDPREPGAAATSRPATTIKRTDVSTEVEKVLSDLYPLLRTVQPAELNMTLNALATALEGRGDQIGENLETVDGYLKRLNPQIPGTRRGPAADLAGLRHLRRRCSPRSAQILRNTVTTTGTLEGREAKLNALFNDVAAFSDTARALPRRQRRQPDPARQRERPAAAGVREVLPGVPLPAPAAS